MNSRIAIAAALLLLLPCAAIAIPHASTPVDVDTSNKLIPAGTLIRIRMLNSLSSASTKEGTYFSWVVSDDVKLGDRVVIPAGNVGWGKVDDNTGQLKPGEKFTPPVLLRFPAEK